MYHLLSLCVLALCATGTLGAGATCQSCSGKFSPYCGAADTVAVCASGICQTTTRTYLSARSQYDLSCYSGSLDTMAECQQAAITASVTNDVTGTRTSITCCSGSNCNSGSGVTQYQSDVGGLAQQTVRVASTAGAPPGQLCYTCNSTSDPLHCGQFMPGPTSTNRLWCTGHCYTATDETGGEVVYSRGCDDLCNVGGTVGLDSTVNTTATGVVISNSMYKSCCQTNNCNRDAVRAASIQCYKCNSVDDPRCEREGTEANTKNDKYWDWAGEGLTWEGKLIDCVGQCYKIRATGKNSEYIERGCRSDSQCPKKYKKSSVSGTTTRTWCCDTDECNSATSLQVSLVAITIAAIYKLF